MLAEMKWDQLFKGSLSIFIILLILYFGRILFIPLFFAILISFIAYPICKWFENKNLPQTLSITLSLLMLFIPVGAIIFLFVWQVSEISGHWEYINEKIYQSIEQLAISAGIEINNKGFWLSQILTGNPDRIFSMIMNSATTIVQIVIVPIYVALMLYHRNRLLGFLRHFFPAIDVVQFNQMMHETVVTYYNFVKGMVLVYLIVGLLNSLGLYLLGIPGAAIYGFIAAILTFIPYVGIIIGSIMPVVIAWGMYDSIYYPLAVVGIFAFVQLLEANLIFPLAVSHRIKVNTLFTLIAIFMGGILWGAAGMIIFIPLLAILKLISEKVDSLKPLNTLLSTNSAKEMKAEIKNLTIQRKQNILIKF